MIRMRDKAHSILMMIHFHKLRIMEKEIYHLQNHSNLASSQTQLVNVDLKVPKTRKECQKVHMVRTNSKI